MYWNNTQQEKGAALYLAIMIMVAVLGIAFGAGQIVVQGVKSLRGIGHSVLALYAAEAGFETVLYEETQGNIILGPGGCDGSGSAPAFCKQTLSNGATYEVLLVDPSQASCNGLVYCVETAGAFFEATRKIQVDR